MPRNDLDCNYIDSIIEINGLRSSKIKLSPTGIVSFGCLKIHITELEDYPNKNIHAQFGSEGVTWWVKYKHVIFNFLNLCYQERNLLELKYRKQLRDDPDFLKKLIHSKSHDQLFRDLDKKSKSYRESR